MQSTNQMRHLAPRFGAGTTKSGAADSAAGVGRLVRALLSVVIEGGALLLSATTLWLGAGATVLSVSTPTLISSALIAAVGQAVGANVRGTRQQSGAIQASAVLLWAAVLGAFVVGYQLGHLYFLGWIAALVSMVLVIRALVEATGASLAARPAQPVFRIGLFLLGIAGLFFSNEVWWANAFASDLLVFGMLVVLGGHLISYFFAAYRKSRSLDAGETFSESGE